MGHRRKEIAKGTLQHDITSVSLVFKGLGKGKGKVFPLQALCGPEGG